MANFKEHGVMLYLSKELYTAFIKLQGDKGLGRSFAGLLPFTEGMFQLGYISEEVYKTHLKKYSTSLVQPKTVTLQQVREKEKIEKLNRHYSGVLKDWPVLNERAKAYHIKKAKELADNVPNAKLVLALANGESLTLRATEKERVLNE